jgi:tRNA/rRNA methyltransferase
MFFHIVLVSPARPENVGAAARAMKTMGFSSLRIVDSDAHLQPPARWVAHGAGDILDGVQTYRSLADALSDVDFTIATTARSRARYRYYCSPQALVEQLQEKQHWLNQAALVFGREDSGLTNEELELADLLTGVPMAADYPSLNLGQSVMVYCYQLSELVTCHTAERQACADAKQLQALKHRTTRLLETIGSAGDTKLSDWIGQRLGFLSGRDTAMLHTLLNDIEKKLKSEE